MSHPKSKKVTADKDKEDRIRKEQRERAQRTVDMAGDQSFPASDPPSWTPTHTGRADRS